MPKRPNIMERISVAVTERRWLILSTALVLCVASVFALLQVGTNYDMASYLPAHAPSTRALRRMGSGVPNLQMYLPDTSPEQAVAAKADMKTVPYVLEVLWLDDMTDLRATPFEMIPESARSAFYREGGALFRLTLDIPNVAEAFSELQARYPSAIFKGDAANQAVVQMVSMGEIASLMYYLVPLVLAVLLLFSKHWFEPVLFFITIGVAILLNEGTNIVFGQISFVTRACSGVLQLAVSIDYAVFLLHRFGDYRAEGMEARPAMRLAMQKAASSIAASALTTIFGFLALLVMDFSMGSDMGRVLAKGVFLSYVSVMVVLPALAIVCQKAIDRTAHRRLVPGFRRTGRLVIRYGTLIAIVLILLLPAAYLGQGRNNFVYGSSGMHAQGSQIKAQAAEVDRLFGRSQVMLLLVPEGQRAREAALAESLAAELYVLSVTSYTTEVGAQIPAQVLPTEALSRLRDGGYERIILYADSAEEGEEAFDIVRRVRALAEESYGEDYFLIGENVVNYDLMSTITADNQRVLLLGVLAIGMVLLVTFRSLSIPLILLLIIEGSIWLNMAVPYMLNVTMNYIGYQIVSSVQLGATVDYGILLSQRYLEGRRTMPPKEAAAWALSISTGSILPPMLILTIAGYVISFVVRSNGVISQMGEIIGRGAAISGVMVLLVLPHVLRWCDPMIRVTTLKTKEALKE